MKITTESNKVLRWIYKNYIDGDSLADYSFYKNFSHFSFSFFKAVLIYLRDTGKIEIIWLLTSKSSKHPRFIFRGITPNGIQSVELKK